MDSNHGHLLYMFYKPDKSTLGSLGIVSTSMSLVISEISIKHIKTKIDTYDMYVEN